MRKFTFTKKKLFPFFNFIFLLLFLFVSFSLIINPIEKKIVQLYFGDSKRPLHPSNFSLSEHFAQGLI